MKSFLIALLAGLCCSSLIYESIPSNSYRERIKKEIISIQDMNAMQTFAFPDHSEGAAGSVITIEKVKPFFTFIHPDMMTYEVTEAKEFKFSFSRKENEISCLMMHFDCDYRNEAKAKEKSSAKFSIIAKSYAFTKNYEQFEGSKFFVPRGKAEISFEIANVSLLNDQITSKATLTALLQKYLERISAGLLARYNSHGISAYYARGVLDQEIKHIYVNKGAVVATNTVTLTPSSVPTIKANAVIHNLNGNINNLTDAGDPLDKDSNNYFIAVNKKLLQVLINENIFFFKIEESQKPIQDYKLNIRSAIQICDELKSEPLDKALIIYHTILSATIEPNNFPAGTVVMKTDLISFEDQKVLLSFNTDMAFKFDMTIFQGGINFRLNGSTLQLTAVAANPDPKRTITNPELLKKWIIESFKLYLINKEYNLLNLSFDLNDFFPKFSSVKIENNYIIIE